ncbi:hypothetical protein GMA12_11830 [Kocuria sediminis]|uniref:TIGR04438 family Trp-rich protein n=1 Tax=Kocuria sediminis TaxID=1038857 RepID=A0A6N8GM32_9MICC|nr:hypothetical protein [Kocuria sediminis]MUN63819.1 hypothetical protein [Kocuria sediminis]
MTDGVRRGIGGALVGAGGVAIFNAAEAFAWAPFWWGGIFLVGGVVLFWLGWRMIRSGAPGLPQRNLAPEDAQRRRWEQMEERDRARREAKRRRRGEDPGDPQDRS